MVPIIVYGKPDDNRFVRELTRILSPLGSCLHLEKNHLLIPSEKAQLTFLLYETPVGCTAEGGKGILILKQDVSPLVRLSIALNYPAIVDSGCENGLKLLQRLKLPAVTCGLSLRDTLSLSSISENSACICLQRDLENLQGQISEAGEFPVSFGKPVSQYALMAGCAVLLLSGSRIYEMTI